MIFVLLLGLLICAAFGFAGYWFAWVPFLGLAVMLLGEVADRFGVKGSEDDSRGDS